MSKILGQTKDGSFQFGIRKTFALTLEDAWEFMFSEKGLNLWLGKPKQLFELKQSFETAEGISGFIRLIKHHSHIRMSWKKPEWDNYATLQIRLIPNHEKTTISFHLEKLKNKNQRDEMTTYWTEVLTKISEVI